MTFQPHPHAAQRVTSATAVIQALLHLPTIYPAHLKRFLSNCLWQITQAEGKTKYDLRYRSRASLAVHKKGELRHEHVYRRKDMVAALIARPDRVAEIVSRAVGCVVTKEEHARLAEGDRAFPEVDGWERYLRARIEVVDLLSARAGIDSP